VLGLTNRDAARDHAGLRETYCGSIGVEFMHIQDPDQKAWIQRAHRVDPLATPPSPPRARRRSCERLTAAEKLRAVPRQEIHRHQALRARGRRGDDPALEQILKRGGQLGVREVCIGMPHRGRLNVLVNFMSKPYAAIFSEFQGQPANPEDVQGSGDVKYHIGTSTDREFDGNVVHLSLQPNPSHLEAVNPVVLGKVRAKQMQRMQANPSLSREDTMGEVMAILMHGDAAFAGPGAGRRDADALGAEGLSRRRHDPLHREQPDRLHDLAAYSRSSPYPTDVGKMVQAPIFHVNGDDPEAVVHVARIATEFRQRFKKDVIIDMMCYRRHGHNESDEPSFTQPQMYRAIAQHPTTRQIYATKLVKDGALSADEAEAVARDFQAHLESQFEAAKGYKPNKADWLEGHWTGMKVASGEEVAAHDTAVPLEKLREVGAAR
jgi:2-oxoglutarate dehydrogenase E1 component